MRGAARDGAGADPAELRQLRGGLHAIAVIAVERFAFIARGTNATQAAFLTQFGIINEMFDLQGAPVLAGYQFNSPTLTASRYVIRGIGRGQVLIGNLAGYSQTLGVPGDVNLNPDIGAFTFRNGVAYELPLKALIGRRAASIRASYAFTNYVGVKLRNNSFHEATLSFGLRGREDTPKQFRDIVRFNLNTIQAKGYHSYTAGIGFRF